jgi:hypothetical protein
MESRTTRYTDGAAVMEYVLAGKGKEIGFGPMTEIPPEAGQGTAAGRTASGGYTKLFALHGRDVGPGSGATALYAT